MSKVEAVGTMEELLASVAESMSRKSGTFGLTQAPLGEKAPFVMVAGHHQAVEVPGGFLVCLGITREQVLNLRDVCDFLLSKKPS
jgi:hypothetical protein